MRECRLPSCNDTTYPGRFPDTATLAAHSSLRAIHSRGHYPWRIKDDAAKPDRWCTPVDAVEPWGTVSESVMKPRQSERQGIIGRSCPKNRGLSQAINGYSGVVIPVLEYRSSGTTITCAFSPFSAVLSDGYPFVFIPATCLECWTQRRLNPQGLPDCVDFRFRQLVHPNLIRPWPRKSLRRPLPRRVDPHLRAVILHPRSVIQRVHRPKHKLHIALRFQPAQRLPHHLAVIVNPHVVVHHHNHLREPRLPQRPNRIHNLPRVPRIRLPDRHNHQIVQNSLRRHRPVHHFRVLHLHHRHEQP